MKRIIITTLVFISTIIASSCSPTEATTSEPASAASSAFTLSSPAVAEGGALPQEYTCDGAGATLPLEWQGAPEGTQSFAIIMHHTPGPGDSHWYWIVYDLPGSVQSLAQNATDVGTLGNNSVNGQAEYAPPCSKGPGLKDYTYTVYALSAPPRISVPPNQVSRGILLAAMQSLTLASAELNVTYSR